MRKLVLIIFGMLAFLDLSAQNDNSALVLHHADGTLTRVELASRPNVTFVNDNVCVTSSSAVLKFAVSDVPGFYYENITTKINDVVKDGTFQIYGENIYFCGVKYSDANVSLFSIDGTKQNVKYYQSGSGLVIPISQVQAGAYILKVNNKTVKLIKK